MAAAPQPPAPATPNTLVTLPDDLLLSILGRVPCKDDRASMSLVCRAWRGMVARLSARAAERRPPLPWLLLPSRFRTVPAFRAACVLSGCCVHPRHNLLTIHPLPPGARFAGSYDGAWIFLHYGQARAHGLFNLRTGQSIALPSLFVRPNDGWVDNMFILAATLSSSPDDPSCIGAAIVAAWRDPDPYAVAAMVAAPLPPPRRFLVFWRMEWAVASEMVLGGGAAHHQAAVYHVEDVVYHDGAFNVLVNYGDHNHILVCRRAGRKHRGTWRWMKSEWLLFRPDERIYGQFVRSRYIVASRGELLKVVRWKPSHDQPTSKFKVFRATKRPQMPDADDFPVATYPWAWSELDTLDGRILFVGYGCSRSYDAAKYPGFKAGIYFLDDGKFYDEAAFFRNHNIRPYPCSDNGKWSDGSVQLCFPTTDPSEHSPPAWLLP